MNILWWTIEKREKKKYSTRRIKRILRRKECHYRTQTGLRETGKAGAVFYVLDITKIGGINVMDLKEACDIVTNIQGNKKIILPTLSDQKELTK